MSGIYIKGMELPKSCFYCPMRLKVDPDNIKCLATGDVFEETFTATIEMRNGGKCPLVPVPPHGDLIDRNALLADTTDMLHSMMVFGGARVYTSDAIKNAPTIIPADKEGE